MFKALVTKISQPMILPIILN